MIARYIGWGLAPNRLRCGCRSMMSFEQVGSLIIATCLQCYATWDMNVIRVRP